MAAPDEPPPAPRTGYRAVGGGDVVGRYVLGDELGTGGMATVYRARDQDLRRDVAVKVLFPHLAKQPEVVRRFHREARAAAALTHPCILPVFDVGGGQSLGGDPPYIVMALIRGRSLRELVDALGAVELAEVVAAIGCQLADALEAAHRAGVVHRDVKPANVMASDDGRLLLADFGVARLDDDDGQLTRTGALLGTPAFMAPEQAAGEHTTAQTDLYALGATLYVLATGVLPGGAARLPRVEPAVSAARRRPAIGDQLARAIAALMELEPARRPADAAAARALLRPIVDDAGLGAPDKVVAQYLADPAAFDVAHRPQVVQALGDRAEAAMGRRERARAMALVDRGLAMAPDDARLQRLAAIVATRPRRRWPLIGLGALGVAGVSVAAIVATQAPAPRSPSIAAVAPIDAAQPDAAIPAVAPVVLDARPAMASAIDAALGKPRGDARRAVDAPPSPPDAPPRPVDAAAPRVDAAAPRTGELVLVMDAWCDVTVDGVAKGRADRSKPVPVPVGRHRVTCSQGVGLAAWSGEVDVAADQPTTVRGSLRSEVAVTVAVDGDRVAIDGATHAVGKTVRLRSGRYRVEVQRGGAVITVGYVDVPRVAACTLRSTPALDCY